MKNRETEEKKKSGKGKKRGKGKKEATLSRSQPIPR